MIQGMEIALPGWGDGQNTAKCPDQQGGIISGMNVASIPHFRAFIVIYRLVVRVPHA